jgi:hypothetical protein
MRPPPDIEHAHMKAVVAAAVQAAPDWPPEVIAELKRLYEGDPNMTEKWRERAAMGRDGA